MRELETSSDNAAIVAAIIAMSKSLKLKVVAEGVETQGQMTRLFDQGCQLMQGFLFSPAVPGDDFPAMLKASTSQSHWRIDFGPRARNKSPSEGQDRPDEHSNGQHSGPSNPEVVVPTRPSPHTAVSGTRRERRVAPNRGSRIALATFYRLDSLIGRRSPRRFAHNQCTSSRAISRFSSMH